MIRVLPNVPGKIITDEIPVFQYQEMTQDIFLNEFVGKNKPCLIKGAIKSWPLIEKWKDLEYLKEKAGTEETGVIPHIFYTNLENMLKDLEVFTFSEAVDKVKAAESDPIMMPAVPVIKGGSFSQLHEDIGHFSFLPNRKSTIGYSQDRFFLFKNAGTGWHYHDIDETLMCQVKGDKLVSAVSTRDTADFFDTIHKAMNSDEYVSGGPLLDSIADKLCYHVIKVEEGDAFYIPPHWWHGVDPIDENWGLTLASCFRSPLHNMASLAYPNVIHTIKSLKTSPTKLLGYSALAILSTLAHKIRKYE